MSTSEAVRKMVVEWNAFVKMSSSLASLQEKPSSAEEIMKIWKRSILENILDPNAITKCSREARFCLHRIGSKEFSQLRTESLKQVEGIRMLSCGRDRVEKTWWVQFFEALRKEAEVKFTLLNSLKEQEIDPSTQPHHVLVLRNDIAFLQKIKAHSKEFMDWTPKYSSNIEALVWKAEALIGKEKSEELVEEYSVSSASASSQADLSSGITFQSKRQLLADKIKAFLQEEQKILEQNPFDYAYAYKCFMKIHSAMKTMEHSLDITEKRHDLWWQLKKPLFLREGIYEHPENLIKIFDQDFEIPQEEETKQEDSVLALLMQKKEEYIAFLHEAKMKEEKARKEEEEAKMEEEIEKEYVYL